MVEMLQEVLAPKLLPRDLRLLRRGPTVSMHNWRRLIVTGNHANTRRDTGDRIERGGAPS
jgi:hypothetical protein